MATPLPDGGLADPRGLFMSAIIGVVVTGNPIFVVGVFALIHYLTIYPTNPAILMGPAMNWEFNVRMLLILVESAVAAYALLVALGSPVLFPVHTTEGRKIVGRQYPIGVLALVGSLAFMLKSGAIFTGLYYIRDDFGVGALGKQAHVTWAIIFFIALLILLIVTVVYTWTGKVSVLSVRYYGEFPNNISGPRIIGYAGLMVLVLAPQAIADFAGAPDGPLPMWGAGLITLGVEVLVWVGVYFFFIYFYDVEGTDFSKKYSTVTWAEFVIILASLQFVTGLLYFLIVGLALDTFEQLEWTIIGMAVLTGLVAIGIGIWPYPQLQYQRELNERAEEERDLRRERKRSQKRRNSSRNAAFPENPEMYDLRNQRSDDDDAYVGN